MKILWIDSVSQLGGAQWSLVEVCGELRRQGVEVVVAVPEGPLGSLLHSKGFEVHYISELRARRRGLGVFATIMGFLRSPSSLQRILLEVEPDIVHANSLTALLSIGTVRRDLPLFWHVRDLRLPYIAAREGMQRAERIIAISEAVDQELLTMIPSMKRGRMRLIRNGVDLDRFKPGGSVEARRELGLPETGVVVGMIAHLVPWKRHDAFIEMAGVVAKELPEAHFVVVGRDLFGEHRGLSRELREKSESLGLGDRFKWVDDCDKIERILPGFTLLVHPARYEPFGRVVCEALACEVAVVAAESGGPANMLEHGKSGLLVPDGEAEGLAQAVVELIRDEEKRVRLARAGRAMVEEQYSVKRVVRELVQEYRATLLAVHGHSDEQ